MRRRAFLEAAAGGMAASLAGCVIQAGTESGTGYDVGMGASVFDPREVTVGVGETVRWRNTNSRAHTVTAYGAPLPTGAAYFASGGFSSERLAREAFYDRLAGAISSGSTYTHTFDTAGEYPYFCIPHERGGMVGRVIVER